MVFTKLLRSFLIHPKIKTRHNLNYSPDKPAINDAELFPPSKNIITSKIKSINPAKHENIAAEKDFLYTVIHPYYSNFKPPFPAARF